MAETVAHDDARSQHECLRCKAVDADELRLGLGIFVCANCTADVKGWLGKGLKMYPTKELVIALLTDSDEQLSPWRQQRLQHARSLTLWAVDAAAALADPAIPDDRFRQEWLDDVESAWARMQGKKGTGPLATMHIVALILAAAGHGGGDDVVLEAFNWMTASWPEYQSKMKFEKFKAAVVGSKKVPDWIAIADVLGSAAVGGRSEWDHETVRTEYQKWSKSKKLLRLDELLHRDAVSAVSS